MLKQIEGSARGSPKRSPCPGRRSFALIRSRLRPTSSEGVGAMVKAGTLENCEFINVESEFAALSVAIGASAVGARTYTATASQGLLFMAEAVYNAAGLGLPIVMTVGNQSHRRADQYLERPQRQHGIERCRLDPAPCRNQPGSGGPAHPGFSACRVALLPRDGVAWTGSFSPTPSSASTSRPRRRSTSSCRPSSPCSSWIPATLFHRRHGGAGGVFRGALSRPSKADGGA